MRVLQYRKENKNGKLIIEYDTGVSQSAFNVFLNLRGEQKNFIEIVTEEEIDENSMDGNRELELYIIEKIAQTDYEIFSRIVKANLVPHLEKELRENWEVLKKWLKK